MGAALLLDKGYMNLERLVRKARNQTLNSVLVKSGPDIARLAARIGLQCRVVEADDEETTIAVAQCERGFHDLDDTGRLRRIDPTLDLDVEGLTGAGDERPDLIII